MKLIDFDGQDFKIADEALLVRPIRDLFRKDKSKSKEEFWKQISYLWFMCDPRSTYMYLVDEKERSREIIKQEGLGDKWSPSPQLKEAMNIYKKNVTTTSSLLLEDMRASIEDVRFILRELGEQARRKRKPGEDADDAVALDKILPVMTKSIKEIPELARALVEAEKALAKDFATEDNARGNASKAVGEDL